MQRRWTVQKPGCAGTLAGHGRTRTFRTTHKLTGPTGQAKRPKGHRNVPRRSMRSCVPLVASQCRRWIPSCLPALRSWSSEGPRGTVMNSSCSRATNATIFLDYPSATSWPPDRLDSDFKSYFTSKAKVTAKPLSFGKARYGRLSSAKTESFTSSSFLNVWKHSECLRPNMCMQGATGSRPVRQSQSACRSTTQSPISNASEDPWVWCPSF